MLLPIGTVGTEGHPHTEVVMGSLVNNFSEVNHFGDRGFTVLSSPFLQFVHRNLKQSLAENRPRPAP